MSFIWDTTYFLSKFALLVPSVTNNSSTTFLFSIHCFLFFSDSSRCRCYLCIMISLFSFSYFFIYSFCLYKYSMTLPKLSSII